MMTEMDRELKRFANFVLSELLDLYQMKYWDCNFEEFKAAMREKIDIECKRWWIASEKEN
jgi:hypothetical protein